MDSLPSLQQPCHFCWKPLGGNGTQTSEFVKLLKSPCEHVFHRTCLKDLLRKNEMSGLSCPKCQRVMKREDVTPVLVPRFADKRTKQHRIRNLQEVIPERAVLSPMEEAREQKAAALLEARKRALQNAPRPQPKSPATEKPQQSSAGTLVMFKTVFIAIIIALLLAFMANSNREEETPKPLPTCESVTTEINLIQLRMQEIKIYVDMMKRILKTGVDNMVMYFGSTFHILYEIKTRELKLLSKEQDRLTDIHDNLECRRQCDANLDSFLSLDYQERLNIILELLQH